MNRIWEKEPPVVVCQRFEKNFWKKTVVDDVSFDVFPGEVIAVVGENGAGKSTLKKYAVRPAENQRTGRYT